MATTISVQFDDERETIFDKGTTFWNNYLRGRPSPPDSFFERIFRYHQEHHGHFGTVHDVGAGNGPYANKLKSKFGHVIISDIAAHNVELARDRLGTDGFTYRAARVEEGDDIPNNSVDMVFATNVMHFCDQKLAMVTIARQLKSGGTFCCAGFGPARFQDSRVDNIYTRIHQCGGRALLAKADNRENMISFMARTQGVYNVAPLDEQFFLPGAHRIHLNMETGGLTGPLPPEIDTHEPVYRGVDDLDIYVMEEGWSFIADLEAIKDHVLSFPFAQEDPTGFAELWQEMEDAVKNGQTVSGHWPVKIILATRR